MTAYRTLITAVRRTEPHGTASFLVLSGFLFFLLFRIPVPMNVDTYVYARATETFQGPIVHLGYYAIGALCHSLLKPIGVTPLQALGCLSHVLGGISVGGMYVFTFLLTENRPQSLLSALILMFSGAFWFYSIHGEVYVPQLAFVLMSLISILRMQPLLSGLLMVIALSITPTSLLALMPAAYLMHMRGYGGKDLMIFAAPILIASSAVMWWDGPSVIRAFEEAVYSPRIFFEDFSYWRMATDIVYRLANAYGRSFHFISFFAVIGLFKLCRRDTHLCGLMIAFTVPFLAYLLNLGLFSPDHLIITFIPVSFLAAFGLLSLLEDPVVRPSYRIIRIPLVLLAFSCLSFELSIYRTRTYSAELQRVIDELSRQSPANGIILADYHFGVSFWSLLHKEEAEELFAGRPHRFWMEAATGTPRKNALDRLEGPFWVCFAGITGFASIPEIRSLLMERPVYLVDRRQWPIGVVPIVRDWLVRLGVERRDNNQERLNNISEYLAYRLNSKVVVKRIIDSPLHPVYVMRFEGTSAEYQQESPTQQRSPYRDHTSS